MARITLVAMLLLGCGVLPPNTRPLPEPRASAALHVWTAYGLPAGSCADVLRRARTVVVDDTRELCLRDARGCRTSRDVGLFGLGGSHSLLVMHRDHASTALEVHELVHVLLLCSGHDDLGDPWHLRVGVWGGHGVEGQIAKAMTETP